MTDMNTRISLYFYLNPPDVFARNSRVSLCAFVPYREVEPLLKIGTVDTMGADFLRF